MPNLTLRKVADKSEPRTKLFDPVTGDAFLLKPEKAEELVKELAPIFENVQPQPRPFLGIKIEGKPPKKATLSMSLVRVGIREGWIAVQGERRVHRSGGPEHDPWQKTHTFMHCDSITIETLDGPVVYKVANQPDKWPETKNDEDDSGHGGEVKWFYELRLEK
jgi:hypothetical protein